MADVLSTTHTDDTESTRDHLDAHLSHAASGTIIIKKTLPGLAQNI
jgi:hypothetical protein